VTTLTTPRRIAVTGASGFIGSSFMSMTRATDEFCFSVDRPLLRSADALADWLVEMRITDVVHLAAHFASKHNPNDIAAFVEGNIETGTVLCQAMAQTGLKRLVTAGSQWMYDPAFFAPISGSIADPMLRGARTIYAATKLAIQPIMAHFSATSELVVVEAVFSDTYGPGDKRGKIFELLIQSGLHDVPLEMTNGEQLLNLIHVTDAVHALDRALDLAAAHAAGIWRYACLSPHWLTPRQLVTHIERALGRSLQVRWGKLQYRGLERFTPWIHEASLPSLPGWSAQWTIDRGIESILAASS